ncbi:hypothetical protein FACS1894130_04130 [Spirochaetia bacterium]|nr:hypothetical protein FACS1894130_04130 [Spirochaetia bacterium]
MNPILPKKYYIPDVEARVWKDGRIYLYGSCDICANTFYCSHEYRVFSSDGMLRWKDHGVSFTGYDQGPNHAVESGILYAPDCVYKDGVWYLYYCQPQGEEGVAVSDNPAGPFEHAQIVVGANKTRIDPAVFIDDDGSAYYYWAQISARAGRLRPNMAELIPETVVEGLITEAEHGFHEGISMRKRNGVYYLVYTDISRGRATSIGYATSDSPLGPFKKQGIIIDNTGCDPGTWNNHGSIQEYRGQWYVFYHRSTHNSEYSRRVCVEPIFFDDAGKIAEVEMTTQGVEGPLDSRREMDAADACLLSGKVYIGSLSAESGFYEYLTGISNGDWAAYKYLNFSGKEKGFAITAASMTGYGEFFLSLDKPDGEIVAKGQVPSTGGWNAFRVFEVPLIKSVEGVHALYLGFSGSPTGRLMDVKNFRFTPRP